MVNCLPCVHAFVFQMQCSTLQDSITALSMAACAHLPKPGQAAHRPSGTAMHPINNIQKQVIHSYAVHITYKHVTQQASDAGQPAACLPDLHKSTTSMCCIPNRGDEVMHMTHVHFENAPQSRAFFQQGLRPEGAAQDCRGRKKVKADPLKREGRREVKGGTTATLSFGNLPLTYNSCKRITKLRAPLSATGRLFLALAATKMSCNFNWVCWATRQTAGVFCWAVSPGDTACGRHANMLCLMQQPTTLHPTAHTTAVHVHSMRVMC